MSKITITIDDANTTLVTALGVDTINRIADAKGYMEQVQAPAYVPAVGGETMDDTSVEPTMDEFNMPAYPQIPNPDYVPAVGTEFMPNPQTRAEFVSEQVLANAIAPWLISNMKDDARRVALETVDAQMKQAQSVIEKVAVITVV